MITSEQDFQLETFLCFPCGNEPFKVNGNERREKREMQWSHRSFYLLKVRMDLFNLCIDNIISVFPSDVFSSQRSKNNPLTQWAIHPFIHQLPLIRLQGLSREAQTPSNLPGNTQAFSNSQSRKDGLATHWTQFLTFFYVILNSKTMALIYIEIKHV